MKTSLVETKLLDDHITGHLTGGEKLLFEARMIIDPVLRLNIHMQRKLYKLVKAYSRREVRSEVTCVEKKLFQNDSFRREINSIFSKP